ncbi:MAG: DUF4388 domain-containing protein [Myxococcales bacterium]|nr:DUF4388 domain-containing protein [Myxococcales bacterium]MCB9650944.1 DUF4388 domain-containing protein [Deltaproteobacteria bacterium]
MGAHTILIADDDDDRAARLSAALSASDRLITRCATRAEAEAHLASHPTALLVVSAALESDGPSLLARNAGVLLAGEGVNGSVTRWPTLRPGFSDEDVRTAIARGLDEVGFTGHLSGISLVDLLQVFHINRRSAVLDLGGDPPTRIWFEDGDIVHAERGERTGEEVLHHMLEARSGDLRTLPYDPEHPRTIDRPFQNVVLDAARVRDERLFDTGEWLAAQVSKERLELTDSDFMPHDPLPEPEPAEEAPELAVGPPDDSSIPSPWIADLEVPLTPDDRRLDALCGAVVAEVPGCVAAALVDLEDGVMVGMQSSAQFPPDFEAFLARYTRELFRGPQVTTIETRIRQGRGIPVESPSYLEEVVLTARHNHHLIRVIAGGLFAVVVVVPRRIDVQFTLRVLRGLQKGLEQNL